MHSLVALALTPFILIVGCGRGPLDQPVSEAGGGGGAGGVAGVRVPAMHRASSECPVLVRQAAANACPLEGAGPGLPGTCQTDSDCNAGRNGRCALTFGALDACVCVYDACVSDADCPGGGACACNPFEIGNTCVTGNCRVDQDCGVAGFCGPVISACADEINEYRCHTAADQCLADSDCPAGEPCLAFSGGPWMCQPPQICR